MSNMTIKKLKKLLPKMLKKADDNGEMNVPITNGSDHLVELGSGTYKLNQYTHHPLTPIVNKMVDMVMSIGEDRSKERLEACKVYWYGMQDYLLKDEPIHKQIIARNELDQVLGF